MATIQLISHGNPDRVFAYRAGRAVSVAQFLGDVAAARADIAGRRHILNLCVDRIVLRSALPRRWLRGQTSLLPPITRRA